MENLTTEKYPAVCSECGKECEVPFKPVTGRAVYCLDCFKEKHKNDVQVNVPGDLFMELCSTFQIESPRSTLKISHPAVFKSYVCRILTEYCKKVKENGPVVGDIAAEYAAKKAKDWEDAKRKCPDIPEDQLRKVWDLVENTFHS